uniref:Uncharacterized protein n=1 Tax=Moniliophthora roreri TaxID=221103 RepID=A0A0W0G0M1_MONRR
MIRKLSQKPRFRSPNPTNASGIWLMGISKSNT